MKKFDFGLSARNTICHKAKNQKRIHLMDLLMYLWLSDEFSQTDKLNKHRRGFNALLGGCTNVAFRHDEYWTFWGLIIACRIDGKGNGEAMWIIDAVEGTSLSAGISSFDPSQYMSITCVREIK